MKRILVAMMFVGTFAQAQHEVKFDFLDAFVMKSLEVSYEFSLNKESSVGVSFLKSFSKDNEKFRYSEDIMLTPYFRYYIPEEVLPIADNLNVFGELFMGINGGRKYKGQDKNKKDIYKDYTDGALGLGGGLKYVSELGFVFEGHLGIARNLFSGDASYPIVPRVGVCIGYQF